MFVLKALLLTKNRAAKFEIYSVQVSFYFKMSKAYPQLEAVQSLVSKGRDIIGHKQAA